MIRGNGDRLKLGDSGGEKELGFSYWVNGF